MFVTAASATLDLLVPGTGHDSRAGRSIRPWTAWLIEKRRVCDTKRCGLSGLLRASQGKRRRELRTVSEIFYLFSPWPGSNKIIAGGEEGEFFGSSVPVKEVEPMDLALKLAAALRAVPKSLTV